MSRLYISASTCYDKLRQGGLQRIRETAQRTIHTALSLFPNTQYPQQRSCHLLIAFRDEQHQRIKPTHEGSA